MPVTDNSAPGVPDEKAVAIAQCLAPSPTDYQQFVRLNHDFAMFIWKCFFHLIEDVGYVPTPVKGRAKVIECLVPLGPARSPYLNERQLESLTQGLRSVRWSADVEKRRGQLYYKLTGTLSHDDAPVTNKRCIIPSPVQLSWLMQPHNELLTRLVWSMGDCILRNNKIYGLGLDPDQWTTLQDRKAAIKVYMAKGWDVKSLVLHEQDRKTNWLRFTTPPTRLLSSPEKG